MDSSSAPEPAHIPLRPPQQVMRLSRLGAFHQSRLSFMRILLRRLTAEAWRFDRPVFDIDAQGVGHAVYCAHGPERSYSLVCFAHDLPPEKRSDRVIAQAWDATFALFDGVPTGLDIARLSRNVPLQEAGRVTERELSVSRANRSVRLWEHVVSSLAAGHQPDVDQIDAVGYLMRTTAVYGSGKLGAADREAIAKRAELAAPFQVEMLSVYLTRAFVRDLVQHMAHVRAEKAGKRAAQLDPHLARRLGIGNSTGLGMAPFLINHPQLFHNWIAARETALQRVRSLEAASDQEIAQFLELFESARASTMRWRSAHALQERKLVALMADLDSMADFLSHAELEGARPWDRLYRWAEERLSVEGQEWLVSLMLEPFGDLVDDLADQMASHAPELRPVDGSMPLARLRLAIEARYDWALCIDWDDPESAARVWYVSAEKQEPRLGERHQEPVEAYEQPLAPGRDVATLYAALDGWDGAATVAEFLCHHPEHRHALRRVQILERAPYAEIRDNTIAADLLPIDLLRCKLSFFGATCFDPRSDRWVRISMFSNAPYPNELAARCDPFWIYPEALHQ